MKKKILLFVLAFAMILTSLSTIALAEEEGAGEGEGEEEEVWQCQCPVHNPDYNGESTTCDGTARRINIAKYAEITTTSTSWHLVNGLPTINDGNWHEGALSAAHHPPQANNYFEMHFAEGNNVTEINFVVNSTGRGTYDGNSVWNELTNNDFTLTVKLYNGDTQVGETITIATKDIQVYTLQPNSQITKITIQNSAVYSTTNVLWEVEVWSNQVEHIWELVNTDTPATCTVEGVGDYACACGATNDDQPIPATGHTAGTEWFIEPAVPGVPAVEDDPETPEDETAAEVPAVPEKHYNKCVNGECTEKLNLAAHNYSSECDVTCNTCATVRTSETTHTYYAECSTKCENCDFVRTDAPAAHTWDHDCDAECNACEETRETEHKYTDCADTECDSVNAEDPSIKCGETRVAPGHVWDNACDNECNACNAANPDYAPGHSYTNACDTDCEICGATRTTEHVYDNACDTTCNVEGCGAVREVPAHVYDNNCDNTCNNCGVANPNFAAHVYDNNCDNECNVCGAANANYADHVYGEWNVTKEATKKEAGSQTKTCTVCGNAVTEEIPMLEGLSGGAVAGIVIGSIAVVAIAAYAAYYFLVVKKKG